MARYCNFFDGNQGKEYRERIYREFLEMEPPTGFDQDLLK